MNLYSKQCLQTLIWNWINSSHARFTRDSNQPFSWKLFHQILYLLPSNSNNRGIPEGSLLTPSGNRDPWSNIKYLDQSQIGTSDLSPLTDKSGTSRMLIQTFSLFHKTYFQVPKLLTSENAVLMKTSRSAYPYN